MNEENFYKTFWSNYLQIESELLDTFKFVDLDVDNYKTYSIKYLKLFLQIGSEIDVCFKEYLKILNPNTTANKIIEYKTELLNYDLDFFDEEVNVIPLGNKIKPWNDLLNMNSVDWWNSYNKVKHQRNDIVTIGNISQISYKFANLENVMTAISALYILLLNIYSKVKGHYNESPVPNSVLFKICSGRWNNCKFFTPIYASIDKNGEMYLDNTRNYLI